MFSLSVPEAALVLLNVVGVVSALYLVVGARGVRSAVVLLCAISVPILGSVIAVVLATARVRNRCVGSRSVEVRP